MRLAFGIFTRINMFLINLIDAYLFNNITFEIITWRSYGWIVDHFSTKERSARVAEPVLPPVEQNAADFRTTKVQMFQVLTDSNLN